MGIVDKHFVYTGITNNPEDIIDHKGNKKIKYNPVQYRWTHGATDYNLGDGLLIYAIVQTMRYKNLVCLGSGGGFIPRIMTQARVDLYEQEIFTGDANYNDTRSIYGGTERFLFNLYNSSQQFRISFD